MSKLDTIVVVLDVTVSRASWELTYGHDPLTDVPEYMEGGVGQLECLTTLPGNTSDGAPVRLAGSQDRTTSGVAARGFITMRVVLDVGVDVEAWRAQWGVHPQDSLASRIAVELNQMSPMRNEVDGTVVAVPRSGGVLIGEDTIRTGGRR